VDGQRLDAIDPMALKAILEAHKLAGV
jgi:hypothetical protein